MKSYNVRPTKKYLKVLMVINSGKGIDLAGLLL